jgi:hypothetical protein
MDPSPHTERYVGLGALLGRRLRSPRWCAGRPQSPSITTAGPRISLLRAARPAQIKSLSVSWPWHLSGQVRACRPHTTITSPPICGSAPVAIAAITLVVAHTSKPICSREPEHTFLVAQQQTISPIHEPTPPSAPPRQSSPLTRWVWLGKKPVRSPSPTASASQNTPLPLLC